MAFLEWQKSFLSMPSWLQANFLHPLQTEFQMKFSPNAMIMQIGYLHGVGMGDQTQHPMPFHQWFLGATTVFTRGLYMHIPNCWVEARPPTCCQLGHIIVDLARDVGCILTCWIVMTPCTLLCEHTFGKGTVWGFLGECETPIDGDHCMQLCVSSETTLHVHSCSWSAEHEYFIVGIL